MFSTSPEDFDSCMTALVGDGKAHWRAVVADFHRLPWYMFAYALKTKRGLETRVHLESWEQALVDVVDATPSDLRIGVYRVDASVTEGFRFRAIRGLWRPTSRGYDEGHLAFMSFDDGDSSIPLDSFQNPVSLEWVGAKVFEATE